MEYSSASELFAHCNHTELYQICRRLGLQIPPATPREELIAYLTGDKEVPEGAHNEIDFWRLAIMSFLLDHWQVVRSQLECPAKSGDERACFNCQDAQVISCIVQNPSEENLLQEHLYKIKRKST